MPVRYAEKKAAQAALLRRSGDVDPFDEIAEVVEVIPRGEPRSSRLI